MTKNEKAQQSVLFKTCGRCGGLESKLFWEDQITVKDGVMITTRHIKAFCTNCGQYKCYAPQTKEIKQLADECGLIKGHTKKRLLMREIFSRD